MTTPQEPAALFLQGRELMAAQEFESAIVIFERVAVLSGYEEVSMELGFCHLALEDFSAAAQFLETAANKFPNSAQIYTNLGVAHFRSDDFDAATVALEKATALDPGYVPASFNLGNLYLTLGRAEHSLECLERAVSLDPNHKSAHLRLGDAYSVLFDFDRAADCYKIALELDARDPDPILALANLQFSQGQLFAAHASYLRVLELNEDCPLAYFNLGYIEYIQGFWSDGLSKIRRACDLDSENAVYWSGRLLLMTACPFVTPTEVAAEHRAFGAKFSSGRMSRVVEREGKNKSRVRVGYLSAAFNHHVCMDFFLPLLAHHSRPEFEIYCYSVSNKSDGITKKVEALSDHWRELAWLSDSSAAELIDSDQLDVLVDIDGHASGNRIGIVCKKPAPIIVNWLGYPNTTGLETTDFRFVDAVTDPIGVSDSEAVETLVRLPNGFLAYEPIDDQVGAKQPPFVHNDYCTFGSFNNPLKLNDDVFQVWSAILSGSPRSILILKNRLLSCEDLRRSIKRKFAGFGIADDRIMFLPYLDAQVDHLLHYNELDIALDPFPFNGGTTTCEALWMGVPVITMVGDRHAARVGASLLETVGVSELVGSKTEEYIELAIELSQDLGRLQTYRQTLRNKMKASFLCDHKAFVGQMESAFLDCIKRAGG